MEEFAAVRDRHKGRCKKLVRSRSQPGRLHKCRRCKGGRAGPSQGMHSSRAAPRPTAGVAAGPQQSMQSTHLSSSSHTASSSRPAATPARRTHGWRHVSAERGGGGIAGREAPLQQRLQICTVRAAGEKEPPAGRQQGQTEGAHPPLILGPPRTICASREATGTSAPASTTAAQPAGLFWVRFIRTASRARRQSCEGRDRGGGAGWGKVWRGAGHLTHALPCREFAAVGPQAGTGCNPTPGMVHDESSLFSSAHLFYAGDQRLARQQAQLLHQAAHQACGGATGEGSSQWCGCGGSWHESGLTRQPHRLARRLQAHRPIGCHTCPAPHLRWR